MSPERMSSFTDPYENAHGHEPAHGVRRFSRPYDAGDLDETIRACGGAIIENIVSDQLITSCRTEIDQWFHEHGGASTAVFRGPPGIRIAAIVNKAPSASRVIGLPDILDTAGRLLAPLSAQSLLCAAEYLESRPAPERHGEIHGLHRSTDIWPHVTIDDDPIAIHAIVPLAGFTVDNGGIWLAMDSHRLPAGEPPKPDTLAQVVANPGDVILIRSDLWHCAGVDGTRDQPRRTLSIGYQVDWLRPIENGFFEINREP